MTGDESRWAPMPPTILTERLRLGPWSHDDAVPYTAMVRERDRRTAAAPQGDGPTPEEVRRVLDRRSVELSLSGIALLAVRVDGTFAGYCGLVVGRATPDEPEIAFELLREFHGHGYATEAASAIVAAAARTGRRQLWASLRAWNAPSFRVLEKVGFFATDRDASDEWGRIVWWARQLNT